MEINRREQNLTLNRFVSTARGNDGFTLIEMLMVMAIISVLAFSMIQTIKDFVDRTKTSRAATEIRGLEKDIISFASEKGRYPTDADIADTAANPGLTVLKDLKDPWGNNYVYSLPPILRGSGAVLINTDFDLYSKGKDGTTTPPLISNNDDDIIRARDGSYVGTAELSGL